MRRAALSLLTLGGLLLAVACGDNQNVGAAKPDAAMSASEFWTLIDEIHRETKYDWEKKEVALTKRLRALATEQLRAYGYHWDAAMNEAYDWRLWAAAYVIHGGCSDDGFSDFRSTIIMLGRETFREALRDPDSLLPAAKASKGDLWHENFGYPVNTVWEEKTGEDYLPRDPAAPFRSEPAGTSWKDEDLPRIVPALWKQYGS